MKTFTHRSHSAIKRPAPHALSQIGMTLIELVVTIVILAIALLGVTAAISSGISQSANTVLEVKAVALAQSYLDEILGKRFDENIPPRGYPPCFAAGCTPEGSFGPDGPEQRDRFDDVDDYHGLDEGFDKPTPLQDAEGNERLGYDNFQVQVEVRYLNVGIGEEEENLGTTAGDMDQETDAKLITVTVSFRGLTQGYPFSVYKANYF